MSGRLPHLGRQPEALSALGWSGRYAEWVALVCLHSGVFVRAQFCHHYRSSRMAPLRLTRRLTHARVAKEHPLPDTRTNQRFCHIHGKSFYRALGVEDVRHRRRPTEAILWRRLLSLDAVVESPGLPWLPTERDKVRYFTRLGIDPDLLPHRVYLGRGGVTTRAFAWKLPVAGDSARAVFVYVDPGLDTTRQLRRWCAEHEALWTALRAGGLEVHVHAVARTAAAALRNAEFLAHHHAAPTPHVPALSEDERETLATIEAALLDNDQTVLRRWGGFIEASRVAAPLRNRADALSGTGVARIDCIRSHVASRVVDDVFAA